MPQTFSAAQLQYIVDRALAERRLTDAVINGYLQQLQEEIRDIEHRLQLLRDAAGARMPVARRGRSRGAAVPPVVAAPSKRRSARASSKNTAARKLQGQYIGFLRQLPEKERPKYQEIARTRGREQAIVAIRKALGK